MVRVFTILMRKITISNRGQQSQTEIIKLRIYSSYIMGNINNIKCFVSLPQGDPLPTVTFDTPIQICARDCSRLEAFENCGPESSLNALRTFRANVYIPHCTIVAYLWKCLVKRNQYSLVNGGIDFIMWRVNDNVSWQMLNRLLLSFYTLCTSGEHTYLLLSLSVFLRLCLYIDDVFKKWYKRKLINIIITYVSLKGTNKLNQYHHVICNRAVAVLKMRKMWKCTRI